MAWVVGTYGFRGWKTSDTPQARQDAPASSGRATLADGGSVEGEIRAPVVVINGRVEGDVHSSERLELAAKARVDGNVHYKVVEMAAGSRLSGRLLHVESVAQPAELPDEDARVDLVRVVG